MQKIRLAAAQMVSVLKYCLSRLGVNSTNYLLINLLINRGNTHLERIYWCNFT